MKLKCSYCLLPEIKSSNYLNLESVTSLPYTFSRKSDIFFDLLNIELAEWPNKYIFDGCNEINI